MKKLFLLILCLSFSAISLCQELSPYDFPPGKEGLKALGDYLVQADIQERQRLTYELLPKKGEYKAVFQEDVIKKLQRYHKRWYRSVSPTIGPRYELQDKIICQQTQKSEILERKGEAVHFPGGYLEIADWLLSDVSFYRLQFVENGARVGESFDVFVYLDDHWRVFPHPYKAKNP